MNFFSNNRNGIYQLSHNKNFMIDSTIINLRVLFLNSIPAQVVYKERESYIILVESEYLSTMRKKIIDSKF